MIKNNITKIINDIKSNYDSRIKYHDDISFKYDSITEFINFGKTQFAFTFEEMGMKFTNEYNIKDIVQSLFYLRSEESILDFENDRTKESFNSLLDSYSWLNLSIILSLKEKKIMSGEFFQDIVFACLFSYCYFPEVYKENFKYLEFYYQYESNNWSDADFNKNYGYADIFQLLLFIALEEKIIEDISVFKKVKINTHYSFVLKNIFTNKDKTIEEVYKNLFAVRNSNSGSSYLDTFNHECWKYFPIEIISVLFFRKRNNIINNNFDDSFFDHFIPFLFTKNDIPNNELTKKMLQKIAG